MAANQSPPPTYAPVILYDEAARDTKALLASAKFNPIWLKWFLDLTAQVSTSGGVFVPYIGATKDINIGTHALSVGREAITPTDGTGYFDFAAQASDPASPGAAVARLYAAQYHGVTRLRHDNEMATDQVLGEDSLFVVKNTTGSALTKGSVVYVNGDAGNVATVALAQANAVPGARALGVIYDTIADGAFGQVLECGTLENFNTNSWAAGDRLWLSPSTPGGLVNIRPSYPNFIKPVGWVLTKGVGNGSVLVLISSFTGGQESGTNQSLFSMQAGAVVGTAGAGYQDFVAQSANPAAPAAGTVRFHSATTQGFTRFEQDNEAPTNLVLGRDNVFIAKNTSGGNFTAMVPVYASGATGNVPNIAAAKSNSLTTLPAIGLTLDAINNNNFGQVMRLGIIASVNTNAFSVGDTLYVDPSTAGTLTKTRPASPNYPQPMAIVLVKGVGNGAIFVMTAPFVGGRESGSDTLFDATAAGISAPAATLGNVYSNTYTPTLTGVSNVSSSTSRLAQYCRVGNTVVVGGQFDLTPTAAAQTIIGVSLPVASNFTTGFEVGGTSAVQGTRDSGVMLADTTNDRVQILYLASGNALQTLTYSFVYSVS